VIKGLTIITIISRLNDYSKTIITERRALIASPQITRVAFTYFIIQATLVIHWLFIIELNYQGCQVQKNEKRPNLAISSFKKGQIRKNEKRPNKGQISLKKNC